MEQCILMQNDLIFKKTRKYINDVYVSMAISHLVCHVTTVSRCIQHAWGRDEFISR